MWGFRPGSPWPNGTASPPYHGSPTRFLATLPGTSESGSPSLWGMRPLVVIVVCDGRALAAEALACWFFSGAVFECGYAAATAAAVAGTVWRFTFELECDARQLVVQLGFDSDFGSSSGQDDAVSQAFVRRFLRRRRARRWARVWVLLRLAFLVGALRREGKARDRGWSLTDVAQPCAVDIRVDE
ncbi:hypothetical protein BDZ97DRAFT_1178587 [Flammula alnicola]|nr:hypothetical protein BDZ97DRAFT_1178587 [Flammula alnicola]